MSRPLSQAPSGEDSHHVPLSVNPYLNDGIFDIYWLTYSDGPYEVEFLVGETPGIHQAKSIYIQSCSGITSAEAENESQYPIQLMETDRKNSTLIYLDETHDEEGRLSNQIIPPLPLNCLDPGHTSP